MESTIWMYEGCIPAFHVHFYSLFTCIIHKCRLHFPFLITFFSLRQATDSCTQHTAWTIESTVTPKPLHISSSIFAATAGRNDTVHKLQCRSLLHLLLKKPFPSSICIFIMHSKHKDHSAYPVTVWSYLRYKQRFQCTIQLKPPESREVLQTRHLVKVCHTLALFPRVLQVE